MPQSNELVDIIYDELISQTNEFWLVTIGNIKVQLPRNKCNLFERDKVMEIPEWLAIKEGLI